MPEEPLAAPICKAPDQCSACGKTTYEMKTEFGFTWIVTGRISPSIEAYACPFCFALHVNKNAIENIQKVNEMLKEREQRRIVTVSDIPENVRQMRTPLGLRRN